MSQRDCSILEGCAFFADLAFDMSTLAMIYKSRYCHSDGEDCARFVVATALGRDAVPEDMHPNDRVWAQEIIEAASVR